jgi:hypothetical protein
MMASSPTGAVGIDASGNPFQRLFPGRQTPPPTRLRPDRGTSPRTSNGEQHHGNALPAAGARVLGEGGGGWLSAMVGEIWPGSRDLDNAEVLADCAWPPD